MVRIPAHLRRSARPFRPARHSGVRVILNRAHFVLLLSAGVVALAGGCGAPRERVRLTLAEGDSALAVKDFDAALAAFKQAVTLDPTSVDAHTKLGMVYKEKGQLNEAATSLETATQLDPYAFLPVFQLGEVYRLMQ